MNEQEPKKKNLNGHSNGDDEESCSSTSSACSSSCPLETKLGKRVYKQCNHSVFNSDTRDKNGKMILYHPLLPLEEDFLRVPKHSMITIFHPFTERKEYKKVKDIELQLNLPPSMTASGGGKERKSGIFSRVLNRDEEVGLGITISQWNGHVIIHKLVHSTKDGKNRCPAEMEGLLPGDRIMGVNGKSFLEIDLKERLQYAVNAIRNAPDPVVLHLQRCSEKEEEDEDDVWRFNSEEEEGYDDRKEVWPSVPDLLDSIEDQNLDKKISNGLGVHPLAVALASKGLLSSENDKHVITYQLQQFNQRAFQHEKYSYLRIDHNTHELRHISNKTVLPYTDAPPEKQLTETIYVPSTPPLPHPPLSSSPKHPDAFIPLFNIHPSLNIRILNTFQDSDDQTAYTIWIYDISTAKEWYAPVRYYRDFRDLRLAICKIHPPLSNIAFFSSNYSWLRANGSDPPDATLLETFLRTVVNSFYTLPLYPRIHEVLIHVQSFLGCQDSSPHEKNILFQKHHVLQNKLQLDDPNNHQLFYYKRAVQLYIHRIFLLPLMDNLLTAFIQTYRTNYKQTFAPTTTASTSQSSPTDVTNLKQKAQVDIDAVQQFMTSLQNLISSSPDIEVLASKRNVGHVNEWIREQMEYEIYVPLRSFISKQLVYAYRHDDLEMQFKILELKKRPPTYFKIHPHPSNYQTASQLLAHGVGRSTLPCQKLRAIVDTAHEIMRLCSLDLSADDFLPIFIYCVVQAELSRPCALIVLLKSLCDGEKKIGEWGYYLASFEAAVDYIRELDLADEEQAEEEKGNVDLLSF